MNTANKLTMLRVILIPVFLLVLLLGGEGGRIAALVIFIVASATDFLDGYIARNYNQVTNFGKFMDPLADKLLVVAAMLVFVEQGQMFSWVLLIVIAREFAVTALRLVAVDAGRVIAAAKSGKVKTACTMVCIVIMLTPLAFVAMPVFGTLNGLCQVLILVTTVFSGGEYFLKNRDVLAGRM